MSRAWGFAVVCRNYSRWSHRRPPKLSLSQEQIVDLGSISNVEPETVYSKLHSNDKKKSFMHKTPKNNKNFDFKKIDKATHFLDKKEPVILSKENSDNISILQNVFDDQNNFVYEKLPNHHKEIGNLLLNLKSKKTREKTGLLLAEGWRMIAEGLQAGCCLKKLLFSDLEDLQKLKIFLPQTGVTIYKMPYREMKLWSNLDTCPGLMGIFEIPKITKMKSSGVIPLTVICDNIREPGNLGTILRSCLGVGCQNVLLTKGCTDLWDSKVIRSAAGAHFHMPIYNNLNWEDISNTCEKDSLVFIADNDVISQFCKEEIIVEDKGYFHENRLKHDGLQNVPLKDAEKFTQKINIPVVPYYEIDFTTIPSVILVIGGETEGISEDCYRFAHGKSGTRLNIPLVQGVDSLNAGAAFAVIAFEIKRQILSISQNTNAVKNIGSVN